MEEVNVSKFFSKEGALLKIIPFILGLLVWTSLKYSILDLLLPLKSQNLHRLIEEPLLMQALVYVIVVVYGIFIFKEYGLRDTIFYIAKIVLFPLYILVHVVFGLFGVVEGTYKLVTKAWNVISTAAFMVIMSGLLIVGSIVITKVDSGSTTFLLTMEILPLVALLSVGWLYAWTFNVLKFLVKPAKWFVNLYLSINMFPYKKKYEQAQSPEQLLETIPIDKREEVIRLLNEPMNNLEKLKNKVNELNIKTFLIHLFTLSFLYIVALEVSIFALEYYGLYKMNLLTGGVGTVHWDYILLSQRGMISNDYGMFESATQWFKALRILQSFIGICLFTVLVTSFSTISAEKGISRKQEFLLYLEETIYKLKTLEQEVSKSINNAA